MQFAFVANNTAARWGGSEELWSQSAAHLAASGHEVLAAVPDWRPPPEQWEKARRAGVKVCPMVHFKSDTLVDFLQRALGCAATSFAERQLSRHILPFAPDLVVISQMLNWDALPWMEACHRHRIPYVVISQSASESFWPTGSAPRQLRVLFNAARHLYFVSGHNLRLTEIQIAQALPRASVVANPFLVDYHTPPDWPSSTGPLKLNLACVARYDAHVKGHDLLFEVLGQPKWRQRSLKVNCFGSGDAAELRRLATFFGATSVAINDAVNDVGSIWRTHHGLVLASRFEGLPLAVVEAMLSHRPCFLTPAGGNREVIRDGISGFVAASATVTAVDEMLETAWEAREHWQTMGVKAGEQIRARIPSDPARQFAQSLVSLCSEDSTASRLQG